MTWPKKINSIIFGAILVLFDIYTYVIHVPKIDMQNYCEIIFMNLELFHVSISEEEGSVNFKWLQFFEIENHINCLDIIRKNGWKIDTLDNYSIEHVQKKETHFGSKIISKTCSWFCKCHISNNYFLLWFPDTNVYTCMPFVGVGLKQWLPGISGKNCKFIN